MAKGEPTDWERLIRTMTLDQLAVLQDHVIDLSKALQTIPAAFDNSFQTKINTILEITEEIDNHAVKFQAEVSKTIKSEIKECIKEAMRENQSKQDSPIRFLSYVLLSSVFSAFIVIGFIYTYT